MEVEDFEKVKKQYKRGSLLNVPNSKFTNAGKKNNTTFASTLKAPKPSMDIEKARQMVVEAKGKIPEMPRYTVTQLKKSSLDQLIRLILFL